MKTKFYQVEITETLQKIVTIEAKNKEDAVYLAEKKYKNDEIELDAFDLVDTNFEIISQVNNFKA